MLVGTTLGVGCMKILITGAKGQLGTDLVKKMRENHDVFPYSSQELDITKLQKFDAEVEKIAPDIIINCAAFTDVDGCESNIERAYLVNSIGAKNCAIISNKYSLKLFHISTDYIFNGESEIPYKEDDIPEPISTYGKSKLSGEINIINHCNKFFILRTAGVYGANGNNFIKTILKIVKKNKFLKVVNDQITTPTYTVDICNQILKLLKTEYYGIYHASSEGFCSWYEFTKTILQYLDINADVVPCTTDEFLRPAKRPKYSVLDNFNLKLIGLNEFRYWKESLKEFLEKYKEEL